MIPLRTFISKALAGGGPCIDIGVHILDLTLWLMGHPKPVAVSGMARTMFGKRPGVWAHWRPTMEIPKDFDVEDFAAAFVRFENGATLMLEVSWLLHHDNLSEDMQMWLYGTDGGAHWPKCELLSTDYNTRQFMNTTLKLTADKLEAARAGMRGVCARGGRRSAFAGAGGAIAAGDVDPRRHLPQPGRRRRSPHRTLSLTQSTLRSQRI